MVTVRLEYRGDLHCDVFHGPSGASFATDAPTENQGRGESFSPTDLVAAALGSCVLTVMGIMARTLEIDIHPALEIILKNLAVKIPLQRVGCRGEFALINASKVAIDDPVIVADHSLDVL